MTTTPASAPQHQKYFFDKFGITERLLERCLAEALSAGGDYADLYFESVASTSIGIDESLVKSASQGVSAGCGIRVVEWRSTPELSLETTPCDRAYAVVNAAAAASMREVCISGENLPGLRCSTSTS